MELKSGALEPQAQGYLFEGPALVDPVCHDLDEQERHGDRGAFKVLALARGVFGQHGDCDVEAGEAGKAAEDEEGEEEVVEWGAKAEGESSGGGRDAKGYLGGRISISLLFHNPSA